MNKKREPSGNQAPPSGPLQWKLKQWKAILWETYEGLEKDHIFLLSAGTSFYAFFTFVPLLTVVIYVYSWLSDPTLIEQHWSEVLRLMPSKASEIFYEQIQAASGSKHRTAQGVTTLVSLVVVLWSSSAGVTALLTGVNAAYEEKEARHFLQLRLLSLLLTLGFLIVGIISFAMLASVPSLLSYLGVEQEYQNMIRWLKWPLLVTIFTLWLAVLYRMGPNRKRPQWRWITSGSILGAVLWLGACFLFSLYVKAAGQMGATYGSLAGIIMFQLWLYLTAFSILTGAELNSKIERQMKLENGF